MSGRNLNKLTAALRGICGRHVLDEKWLVAPSNRIGYQWLETVTRSGQPVLNVRVMTIRHMALDIASPVMEDEGLTFLTGLRKEILINRVFDQVRAPGGGYLTGLQISPGLVRALAGVIRDLRLAGVDPARLETPHFEVSDKGREIRALLSLYEQALDREKRVDDAGVLRMAAARLKKDGRFLPDPLRLLMPEGMDRDLSRLERMFLGALPLKAAILPEDAPGGAGQEEASDLTLLRWLSKPDAAPPPRHDGTASIFHAVGEINEVREVMRRCAEAAVPLDDVEIILADSAAYVPLFYEMAATLPEEGGPDLPVTFYDGIPTRYARPARALMGWLAWLREGRPALILARMIQDGLLSIEGAEEKRFSFERLGGLLRNARAGRGLGRCLEKIDDRIKALKRRTESGQRLEDDDGNPPKKRREEEEEIEGLKIIRALLTALRPAASGPDAGQRAFLKSAEAFLEQQARCAGQFDEYSRERLLDAIRELSECLEGGDIAGWDVRAWLEALPRELKVAGRGPRDGCLYVSPLRSGGHSGRRHTFILGLDDSRFPGSGIQDPVLLDSERGRISDDLPTAARRAARQTEDLAALLARLRGAVTLSYSARDIMEDRDRFPGPPVLSAYRILTGSREGSQNDLIAWLGAPASFAPASPGRCLSMNEWWLSRLCGGRSVENAEEITARRFPHLGRGFQALRARESDSFTEYDGYVPEAGQDFDPEKPLSASRLERLGACPMAYFFKDILRIESPEDRRIDPALWIDPMQKGGLLHDVFRAFMAEITREGRPPDYSRDEAPLIGMLDESIEILKAEYPPPNPEIFERERRDMHRTARIFLVEEEKFCRTSLPRFFEAAIGVPPEGSGTPLDTPEPVHLTLPGGFTIRARGRIDRVDEVPGSDEKRFTVWDYKTGGAYRYMDLQARRPPDPYDRGRLVQGIFYMALAEDRLRAALSPEASVILFGYFFPGIQAHGERIQWEARDLREGRTVIAQLLDMLRQGCFAFSDDEKDVRYSDYLAAFGDTRKAARQIAGKLENPDNRSLEAFAALRGYERTDGEEE
jgi:ATP-dependent helicase/nuclease subunit B